MISSSDGESPVVEEELMRDFHLRSWSSGVAGPVKEEVLWRRFLRRASPP